MVNKILFLLVFTGASFCGTVSRNDDEQLEIIDEIIFGVEPQIFENKILEAINNLKDFLKNGNPSSGVGPVDPFFLPYKSFDFYIKDTTLKGFFQNVTISKFSNFEPQNIQFKLLPLLFKINIFFQELFIDGRYEICGNLFKEIPVNGTGKFKSETGNMTLSLYLRMNKVNSSLQIKDITFEYKILKEKITYVNELEGNQTHVLDEKVVFKILDKIQKEYIPPLLHTGQTVLNDFLLGYTSEYILQIILEILNKN